MNANEKFQHIVNAARDAVEDFRDDIEDRAIVWAAKEIARLISSLEMYETHMSIMQKDAEKYLTLDNNCNKDWFVSRILYHLDGPMQREVQSTAREALGAAQ